MRLIRHSVFVSVLLLLLVGCGEGGGGSDTAVSGVKTQSLMSVTGVFADDMPVARAVITVTDAQGVTRGVTTDDHGLYYIEVNDLTLPLLVVGTYTEAGVVHTQYSFVSADKSTADTVTANINEYTTLLVAAMAQKAGVALDTAPEALDDTTRNLILGVDYLPTIASMEELFCSVLLNPDGTPQGCEWGEGEDLLTTSYVPTLEGNSVDKLVALMEVSVDVATGEVTIADSTGVTIATVSLADIVADTIPADTLTPTDAANIEVVYVPAATITPIENEDVHIQLPSNGTARGVVHYTSNELSAQILIENLTDCPVEKRSLDVGVLEGENAQEPVIHFADYQLVSGVDAYSASVSPIDSCKPYAFAYAFEYNFQINKTQTGLVDGVPVWTYDVPACEQYSNKTLEAIYEEQFAYTEPDFDLIFNQPTVTIRPALNTYAESWPPAGMSFVYDPSCPMVADFSMTPTEGTPSLTVNVDASNSVGNLVSYEWLATGYQTSISETGPTTSFTFDTAGTYTIELTVTDTNGQADVLSKTVIVDPLPQASFTSTLGSASNQIKLNAVNSTGTGISYSWTTSDGQTATGQNVDFTFAAPGVYTVTLVVTDQYDNTSTISKEVTVEEIIAQAIDDTFILTGALDHTVSSEYTIDVLANDINMSTAVITSIDMATYLDITKSVRIADDGKSIVLDLIFLVSPASDLDSNMPSSENLNYSFTYTVLVSGRLLTASVTVDLTPTTVSKTTWGDISQYDTAEVTTMTHPILGHKIAVAHGITTYYDTLDANTIPIIYYVDRTTTYVNAHIDGTTNLYGAYFNSSGVLEPSTCPTKVIVEEYDPVTDLTNTVSVNTYPPCIS